MKDYKTKFDQSVGKTYFNLLNERDRRIIRELAFRFRFTFQELRQVTEIARDLQMWGGQTFDLWWQDQNQSAIASRPLFFNRLRRDIENLKSALKEYPESRKGRFKKPGRDKIIAENTTKNIFGACPVQSEKTVCCNLKTIDAVESCVFGCSYCTIQTFYKDKIVIDADLPAKLKMLDLDPQRNYHIGTGQSSDSLVFGNRKGMLDALAGFAADHPNVILELKTKSKNIQYFKTNETPANLFCSWSLNPQIIINNEEHFTAGLEDRLQAARTVADRNVKVAFHFHPIILYREWKKNYTAIAERLLKIFDPREVLFISFGSVTFIKPVLKKIRQLGLPTKISQMEFVTDPHGKMTYPDPVKVEKFSTMYQAFTPWHDKVFFYLCMEKRDIWEKSFGWVFEDNQDFERALFSSSIAKIKK